MILRHHDTLGIWVYLHSPCFRIPFLSNHPYEYNITLANINHPYVYQYKPAPILARIFLSRNFILTMASQPVWAPRPTLTKQLQDRLLENVKELKSRRIGKMDMHVCLTLPDEPPSTYQKANVCELIKTHKLTNAYIYLDPKYSNPPIHCPSEVNQSVMPSFDPVEVLRDKLHLRWWCDCVCRS